MRGNPARLPPRESRDTTEIRILVLLAARATMASRHRGRQSKRSATITHDTDFVRSPFGRGGCIALNLPE
jgi:hypothetical protein